jgi:hypothetical protein
MRSKATELSKLQSNNASRQLSRLFLAHWENIERDAMDVFNQLLDVDEEVVHSGANVDLSALHALIEELRGCGAAGGSLQPLELDEFLVPKEISLLRKATFSSRLGELRMKPLKVQWSTVGGAERKGEDGGGGSGVHVVASSGGGVHIWDEQREQRVEAEQEKTEEERAEENGAEEREAEGAGKEKEREEVGSCTFTPLTSPPPTSVQEEEDDDDDDDGGEVNTPGGTLFTPPKTRPRSSAAAMPSSTGARLANPFTPFHTPGSALRTPLTAGSASRADQPGEESHSRQREALTEAPCGAPEIEAEAESSEAGSSGAAATTTTKSFPQTPGLSDGDRWGAEAVLRGEAREEARGELWEGVRGMLEEVKGVDHLVDLDDIARRLGLEPRW